MTRLMKAFLKKCQSFNHIKNHTDKLYRIYNINMSQEIWHILYQEGIISHDTDSILYKTVSGQQPVWYLTLDPTSTDYNLLVAIITVYSCFVRSVDTTAPGDGPRWRPQVTAPGDCLYLAVIGSADCTDIHEGTFISAHSTLPYNW